MDIECISAVTFVTQNMERSVEFYRTLGFPLLYGGEDKRFTSFRAGNSYLNLTAGSSDRQHAWTGRVIFYTSDVDALYEHAVLHGLRPEAEPRNAEWGERFFHLTDPDGHQISFAKPLGGRA
jgi:catechol 2,3-dioxygenase-like lactoylglutathione lyase family enzyme